MKKCRACTKEYIIRLIIFSIVLGVNFSARAQSEAATSTKSSKKQSSEKAITSGNPIFPGWYADPEARIFNKQYWIYPTYSAKYEEQVFFLDAFFFYRSCKLEEA